MFESRGRDVSHTSFGREDLVDLFEIRLMHLYTFKTVTTAAGWLWTSDRDVDRCKLAAVLGARLHVEWKRPPTSNQTLHITEVEDNQLIDNQQWIRTACSQSCMRSLYCIHLSSPGECMHAMQSYESKMHITWILLH